MCEKIRVCFHIQDLTDILKHPHPAVSYLKQGTAINTGIKQLNDILGHTLREAPADGPRVNTPKPPRVEKTKRPPATPPKVEPTQETNKPKSYGIGTIIRKRFNDFAIDLRSNWL